MPLGKGCRDPFVDVQIGLDDFAGERAKAAAVTAAMTARTRLSLVGK
jgi:hypothetical protein